MLELKVHKGGSFPFLLPFFFIFFFFFFYQQLQSPIEWMSQSDVVIGCTIHRRWLGIS
jgi:hypothetical protein